MPKDKFDVAVITSGNGPLIEKLDLAGIRTIILPALQSKNGLFAVIFSLVNFSSLFELFKIFKNERPDVIHLNSSKIGGLGAVAAKLSSFIIHHSSYLPSTAGDLKKTVLGQAARLFFSLAGFPPYSRIK